MPERGKREKLTGKAESLSNLAGLQFPVGGMYRLLRQDDNRSERVGIRALVWRQTCI